MNLATKWSFLKTLSNDGIKVILLLGYFYSGSKVQELSLKCPIRYCFQVFSLLPSENLTSMESINTGVTQREIQVLKLIAAEYSSDEIAQQLYISSDTVKSHRRNLLCKMDAKNTAGLVRRAFEQRLLSIA